MKYRRMKQWDWQNKKENKGKKGNTCSLEKYNHDLEGKKTPLDKSKSFTHKTLKSLDS